MNEIRIHHVTFRVTDQELERIKTASDRQGARCISDFARAIMLGSAESDTGANSADFSNVNAKLVSFEQRLAMIELHVSRLADALPDSKAEPVHSEN
jgi:hypothetical protein